MRRCSFLIALALCGPTAARAVDGSVPGAKDLFYDPSHGSAVSVQVPESPKPVSPSPAPRKIDRAGASKTSTHRPVVVSATSAKISVNRSRGLHYWIELEEPGGGSYVSDQYIFRSGQRIRLHFVSNTDGRILLIQVGASGTSSLLFPSPAKGVTDNHLKAGEARVLPGESYWFRFDSNPGTERLLAVFARDETELQRFPVKPEMGPGETKELIASVGRVQGSKDLVIETETRTASEVGTYGVNLKGEPVILEILLQHR